MSYASDKNCKVGAKVLTAVYNTVAAKAIEATLAEFKEGDPPKHYPAIEPSRHEIWSKMISLLDCSP